MARYHECRYCYNPITDKSDGIHRHGFFFCDEICYTFWADDIAHRLTRHISVEDCMDIIKIAERLCLTHEPPPQLYRRSRSAKASQSR